MKLPIYTPLSYKLASEKEKKKVCNGCGSKGGIKVPDTMWGLLIVLACQIHDWMFFESKTLGDYYFSNIMFFWNMFAIIWNESNWFTVTPRLLRALTYFRAVMTKLGLDAFWVDKKKNVKLNITIKGVLI